MFYQSALKFELSGVTYLSLFANFISFLTISCFSDHFLIRTKAWLFLFNLRPLHTMINCWPQSTTKSGTWRKSTRWRAAQTSWPSFKKWKALLPIWSKNPKSLKWSLTESTEIKYLTSFGLSILPAWGNIVIMQVFCYWFWRKFGTFSSRKAYPVTRNGFG